MTNSWFVLDAYDGVTRFDLIYTAVIASMPVATSMQFFFHFGNACQLCFEGST